MKIVRILLSAVVFAAITGYAAKSDGFIAQMLMSVSGAVLGAIVSSAYELIDTKEQGFKTWFLSQIRYRQKSVYLSFSYLYKIEVDNKYLLIRGNRLKNRYQPVGGVYKYYREAKPALEKLNCHPDTRMKNDEELFDIRLNIPGKNVLKFIEWFKSMENREYDPLREFSEELLDSGLLPKECFEKIDYRKIYTRNIGFSYYIGDEAHKKERPEVIYSDIFEIVLNEAQKDAIRKSVRENPDQLCLVTHEEISTHCCKGSVERNIGNNAPWILGEE